MPAAYTDAAAVAAALRLAPDTTLIAPVAVGDMSISVSSNQNASGLGIYPGMWMALDQYNLGARESVQVTGEVTGTGPYTVPITAAANAHVQGAPVKEVSALQDVVDAGSRLWDDATYTAPGAFVQQQWTETVEGQATNDGRILVRVSGRNVQNIVSMAAYGPNPASISTWHTNPNNVPTYSFDTTDCTFDDYQIWIWPTNMPSSFLKHLIVSVTYNSGYEPLPSDIVRASTVLAARLYKEGDSGFSDVLANTDMGILQYKKGIPGDIALMAKRWRRWT